MRILALLAITVPLAISASAALALDRPVLTSLKGPACKGEPGNRAASWSEHGHVIYHCKGIKGWHIRLVYRGTSVIAEFIAPNTKTAKFTLYAPYDIGPRIEWHDAPGQALAAIVRLHARTSAQATESALAVLGISSQSMCLAVLVNGKAKGANSLARKAALSLSKQETCPAGSPRLIGGSSGAMQLLMDANK